MVGASGVGVVAVSDGVSTSSSARSLYAAALELLRVLVLELTTFFAYRKRACDARAHNVF